MGGRILSIQMEGSEGAHLGVWGWGSAFWDTSVVSAKALGWQVQRPRGGRCKCPGVAGAKALGWQMQTPWGGRCKGPGVAGMPAYSENRGSHHAGGSMLRGRSDIRGGGHTEGLAVHGSCSGSCLEGAEVWG